MNYCDKFDNFEKGTNLTKIIDLSNILNDNISNVGSKNLLSTRSVKIKSSILNKSKISSRIPTARKDVE